MGKTICGKHEQAYETRCPYCEEPAVREVGLVAGDKIVFKAATQRLLAPRVGYTGANVASGAICGAQLLYPAPRIVGVNQASAAITAYEWSWVEA